MARNVYVLTVGSEEQTLELYDGYTAEIKFDRCYKRWYYNLYLNGVGVAYGVALNPDTAPLLGYVKDSIGLLDTGNPKEEYEPYLQLGDRLELVEITE